MYRRTVFSDKVILEGECMLTECLGPLSYFCCQKTNKASSQVAGVNRVDWRRTAEDEPRDGVCGPVSSWVSQQQD